MVVVGEFKDQLIRDLKDKIIEIEKYSEQKSHTINELVAKINDLEVKLMKAEKLIHELEDARKREIRLPDKYYSDEELHLED